MAEIHDLLAPYALDALDPGEMSEFEAHLAACTQCRAELAELSEGVLEIADSLGLEPPPRVKRQVMASIGAADADRVAQIAVKRPAVWLMTTAIAAVVAIVFAGLWIVSNSRLEQADLVAAVYEAPDALFIELETANGDARFVYSPSLQRGVFNGSELGAVGAGELYQLWLIDGGPPVSAGTLEPGVGDVVVESVVPGVMLAMTVEEAPGSDAPTSDPLFVTDL